MNRVPTAERMSQAQRVEARTKAEQSRIEAAAPKPSKAAKRRASTRRPKRNS